MAIEIERKFLVDVKKFKKFLKLNDDGYCIEKEKFIQGYLSLDPVVRLRHIETKPWSGLELTIKGKGKVSRLEVGVILDDHLDARKGLFELCKCKLVKTRYHILDRSDEPMWVVDEFHGKLKGVWLAEVELTREDEPFHKPEWVGKEVSYDSRYSNVSLSRKGKPKKKK